MVLEWILAATILVSLASLAGVLVLPFKKKSMDLLLFAVIAFAAGTLLGAAFLDLLPEASERIEVSLVFFYALAGILAFFAVEKLIHWHHHHRGKHHAVEKPLAYLNLIGDSVHNFFDGVAISASFLAGTDVGIATTVAVVLHEIPQEIGDFGLLIYSGFSHRKALFFNLLSALFCVLGAVLFYYFSSAVAGLSSAVLAFTGGMFTYIATSTLLPEFQKETELRKSFLQFTLILLGVFTVWLIATYVE